MINEHLDQQPAPADQPNPPTKTPPLPKGVMPNDPTTWDVPKVMQSREELTQPHQQDMAYGGSQLPYFKATPQPKPIERQGAFAHPGLDAPRSADPVTWVSHLSTDPAGRRLPPAVLLSLADGDLSREERMRAAQIMARRYDVPASWYGLQNVSSGYFNVRTQEYLTVERADNLMRIREPKVIARVIGQLPTDAEQRVALVNQSTRGGRYKDFVGSDMQNPTQEDTVRTTAVLMASPQFRNVGFETVIGMGVQIAGMIGHRKGGLKLFEHNLGLFKDQTLHWSIAAALAEQATVDGVKLATAEQAGQMYLGDQGATTGPVSINGQQAPGVHVNGISDEDRLKLMSHYGRPIEYQGSYYAYDPLSKTYSQLTNDQLNQIVGWQGLSQADSIVHKDTAPGTWLPPQEANTPTQYGGAFADPILKLPIAQQLLAVQQGFNPALLGSHMNTRPQDYYGQSQVVARNLQMQKEAWSNSFLGHTLGIVGSWMTAGYRRSWSTAIRTLGIATYWPARWMYDLNGGNGREAADQYERDMIRQANAVEEGRTTASMIAATNIQRATGMPKWTVPLMAVTADLITAKQMDPLLFMMGGAGDGLLSFRYLDSAAADAEGTGFFWRGVAGALDKIAPGAEDATRGESLLARLTKEHVGPISGLKGVENINDKLKSLDSAIGMPLFADYGSAQARFTAFANMFVESKRWWLGGLSIPEYLVKTFEQGQDKLSFWIAANGKLRATYSRNPFSQELTDTLFKTLETMNQAKAFTEADMVSKVSDLILSGFGVKNLDAGFFQDLVYATRPTSEEDLWSGIRGTEGVPHRGFATWDQVQEFDTSPRAAFNAQRGIAPDVVAEYSTRTGYNIDEVLNRTAELEARFFGEGESAVPGAEQSYHFRNTMNEVPRFSPMRALKSRILWGEGDAEMSRALRALANHTPEADVQFEAGKYEENIRRRLVRSRVYTQDEITQQTEHAAMISRVDNPTREQDMISFLEHQNRVTFDRIAHVYGIDDPGVRDTIFQRFMDGSQADKRNFARGEAYGVKLERDAEGNIVATRIADTPQGTTQLINQWFAPDPIAMRRVMRGVSGDLKSFSQWVRRIHGSVLAPVIPEELLGSAQRGAFHQVWDTVLTERGLTASQIQASHEWLDQMALSAMAGLPDRFPTADSFFESLHVSNGEITSATEPALFQVAPQVGTAQARDVSGLARSMPRGEDGYLYHTTTLEQARSIAQGSLDPVNSAWPDGSFEPRSWWSHNPNTTMHFADGEGKAVLLRTSDRPVYGHDITNPDYRFSNMPIKADSLEYYGSDGQWHPMADATGNVGDALFQRVIQADPDLTAWNQKIQDLLGAGGDEHLWYEASKATLEDLGHRFLTGTVTLGDGRTIPEIDFFTQILAVQSPQKSVAQDLKDTLNWYLKFKASGYDASAVPPAMKSIENSIVDIVAGSRRFEDLTPTMQKAFAAAGYGEGDTVRTTVDGWSVFNDSADVAASNKARQKTWNFYHNLIGESDKVTVDTWMARIFGYDGKFTKSQYQQMAGAIRKIAADNGITPMQAQAAMWVIYKRDYADLQEALSLGLRQAADAAENGNTFAAADIVDKLMQHRDIPFLLGGEPDVSNPSELRDLANYFAREAPRSREANSFADLAARQENLDKFQTLGNQNGGAAREVGAYLNQVRDGGILGSTQFGPDGEAFMRFFRGANVNTVFHELSHVVRPLLSEADLKVIENEIGDTFGDLGRFFGQHPIGFGPSEAARTRAAEEKFAALAEKYFETGQASPATQPILERIRSFLAGVWKRFRGANGSDISPEANAVLEKWFGSPDTRLVTNDVGARILSPDEVLLGDKTGGAVAAKWIEEMAHNSAEKYIRYWKPWQVLRPAYILRVPALDEQIRFLTEFGLSERIRAQGVVAKGAAWLGERGLGDGWETTRTVIPTKTGPDLVLERSIPGALPAERYANNEATGLNAYSTFTEQAAAIANDKALTQEYGQVFPAESQLIPPGEKASTEKEYAATAETALNGHISESPHGFMALQDITNGVDAEKSKARILDWFENDTMGKATAARLRVAPDELPTFVDDYVNMVRDYAMEDPQIADAAMHHALPGSALKAKIDQQASVGESWLSTNRLPDARALPAVDEHFNQFAESLRQHILANGGATFDPVTGKPWAGSGKDVWAVGVLPKTALTFDRSVLEDASAFRAKLQEFMDNPKVRDALENYKQGHVGAWVADDGTVHLDPSVVTDHESALSIGLARKQEGIQNLTDLQNGFEPSPSRPHIHGLKATTMSGGAAQTPYESLVGTISKRILQEPTNHLSRQPFFKAWYDRMLQAQIEMAKSSGFMPEDAAAAQNMVKVFEANARRFALGRVEQIMFNIQDTNRVSEMLWFAAPFSQPFFEAFSVYGNLLRRNPALVPWAMRVFQDARDAGMLRKNDQGQWAIPYSNWLGMSVLMRMISGSPHFEMSEPLSSLNLFYNNAVPVGNFNLPFPGFSPPFQWLVQQFIPNDSSSRLATWAHQYGDVNMKNILPFPTWMQNAIQAVTGGHYDQQQFNSYVDSFMQADQAAGMKFPNADAARAYAENQTKVFYRFKVGISLFFPGAPTITFPTKDLENEWQQLVQTEGPLKARDDFLARHPDDWLIVTAKTLWNQQDPNLPDSFGAVPLPANHATDAILNMPGFKEFAQQNPWWAWALLPPSVWGTDSYDADSFFKQLSASQRTYLNPTDFYKSGQAAAGWHAYWGLKTWWDAKQEYLKSIGVSETDPEFLAQKALYQQNLQALQVQYPGFADTFGAQFGDSDPRALLYARSIAANPFFQQFPMGQSLNDYLKMRDGIQAKMTELGVTNLDTIAGQTSGLQAEYQAGLQQIISANPSFQQVADLFFSHDLTSGVPNKGLEEYQALQPDQQSQAADWQTQMNAIQNGIRLASDVATRSSLYGQENDLVARAYTDYPGFNPATIWWDSQDYTRRNEITTRTQMKPYIYLNSFERQTVLGEQSSPATEDIWNQYNAASTEIAKREAQDPAGFDSGAQYDRLNQWLAGKAAGDPLLATQIQHANTWGYEFWNGSAYATQPGQTGEEWSKLRDQAWSIMNQVRAAGLHGGKYDTEYARARAFILQTAQGYMAADPAFKNQWNYLEGLSSADFLDTIMPPSDYPIGSTS